MRLYKLLKDLPTVKAGAIFKEKIKIDGTRVLKACESGRKHSILVREIDNWNEMKISPKFMKNADPQDVVIVLGVYVLIISIIVFLHWAAVWEDQMSEREVQYTNTKARCKTVGGEMGYSKCYKNGKEI